jgi:hypothetical protein
MTAVLDAFSNLCLPEYLMRKVMGDVLERLPSAAAGDLPVVVKFLMHALATTTFSADPTDHDAFRIDVMQKIRTDIQFVRCEDDTFRADSHGCLPTTHPALKRKLIRV